MRTVNRGQNLRAKELKELENNIIISEHAKQRLEERNSSIEEFMNTVKNPFLAYFNTDYSINIAPNEWQCYIVDRNKNGNGFVLVTYKEEVWLPMTKKQKLAQKGIDRSA